MPVQVYSCLGEQPVADDVLYRTLLDTVPPERVSVLSVMHCMLEQVWGRCGGGRRKGGRWQGVGIPAGEASLCVCGGGVGSTTG
eukprot:366051-Chlamydomonas_euryale.AAC.2